MKVGKVRERPGMGREAVVGLGAWLVLKVGIAERCAESFVLTESHLISI